MRTRAETNFGDPEKYTELMKPLAFGRAAKPEEIGWMAAFLGERYAPPLNQCQISQFPLRRPAGFIRGHAAGDIFVGQDHQVSVKFGSVVQVRAGSAKETMPTHSSLRTGMQNTPHGPDQLVPVAGLFGQLLPARGRKLVILCLPIRLRCAPLGSNPAALFHPVESWIDGALLYLEQFIGCSLYMLNNAVTV